MEHLFAKSYPKESVRYLEIEGGKHEVSTWAKAMPQFLRWGWGKK
jgi:enterochelin esterase-like enzyme